MINQTMVKKAKLDDHFVFYMLPTSSNQGKRDQKSQCGKRISPNTGVIINTHAEWQIRILIQVEGINKLQSGQSIGVMRNSLSGLAWCDTKDSRSKSYFYGQKCWLM